MKLTSTNIAGMVFNRLTVVAKATGIGNRWDCLCACGKTTTVVGYNLVCGNTNSCGCYGVDQRKKLRSWRFKKKPGESLARTVYLRYRHAASSRGLSFDLDYDFFLEITQRNCFYCDGRPNNLCRAKKLRGEYLYSGLDRYDNDLGYIESNCVPCCAECNLMKSDRHGDEFLEVISKIYENYIDHEPAKKNRA